MGAAMPMGMPLVMPGTPPMTASVPLSPYPTQAQYGQTYLYAPQATPQTQVRTVSRVRSPSPVSRQPSPRPASHFADSFMPQPGHAQRYRSDMSMSRGPEDREEKKLRGAAWPIERVSKRAFSPLPEAKPEIRTLS